MAARCEVEYNVDFTRFWLVLEVTNTNTHHTQYTKGGCHWGVGFAGIKLYIILQQMMVVTSPYPPAQKKKKINKKPQNKKRNKLEPETPQMFIQPILLRIFPFVSGSHVAQA